MQVQNAVIDKAVGAVVGVVLKACRMERVKGS